MPINGQSIGKDVSIDIVTARGNFVIPASAITSFEMSPDTTSEKRKGLDGVARFALHPDGWKGTMEIDRFNSDVEDYWAQFEADYYAGINTSTATALETITEADGSTSQYRYTGLVIQLDTLGSRSADKVITSKVSLMASRRIKVS